MSVDANALERETLERKDRDELQKIVGALGGKATSRTRKADLIDQILEITGVVPAGGSTAPDDADADADDATPTDATAPDDASPAAEAEGDDGDDEAADDAPSAPRPQRRMPGEIVSTPAAAPTPARNDDAGNGNGEDDGEAGGRRRRRRGRNRDAAPVQDEWTGEPIPVTGVLDLRDDGYGFLRVEGLLPSKDDCYVSVKQVRQLGLRKGDLVAGGSRPPLRNEKNPAVVHVDTVNDVVLEPGTERALFEDLPAVFATEAISLAVEDEGADRTIRALDLLAPIGKGSRVLLLAPPRTGRTTLLQALVRSVEVNEPDASLVVVLLDERPEEITEMSRLVGAGTVHGCAFDQPADDQVAVLELAMARVRRMAEGGDDVVVVVDGLSRLARAQHAASPGTGRSLGGLDVAAIDAAKRCFGTGRDLEGAGSVTMIATADVDTSSPVDDAVVDAVRGGATTVIRLDRAAAERRAFPALDVGGTGTRHEELLVGEQGHEQRDELRRLLAGLPAEAAPGHDGALDALLARLRATESNDELLAAVATEEAKD